MLKKRLIFTLLFNNGQFVLSRNFRLQDAGDIKWLQTNYNFSKISHTIDELIILNVSRNTTNSQIFLENIKEISKGCFVPITVGGHINSLRDAKNYLDSGADKILVNSNLFFQEDLIGDLAIEFGQQCIVACLDFKKNLSKYEVITKQGSLIISKPVEEILVNTLSMPIGELLLNSVDRDGTGQGLDFEILNLLPTYVQKPIILSGGVGNSSHLFEGLQHSMVNAISTANLFNFVGDGLLKARENLIKNGVKLAKWNNLFFEIDNEMQHD